jgi:hypothetical protein
VNLFLFQLACRCHFLCYGLSLTLLLFMLLLNTMLMKRNMLLVFFLLLGIAACKPRKATDFKNVILHLADSAKNIVLIKESPEEIKQQSLLKQDYPAAAAALEQEEQAFNALIRRIQALSTEGIKEGEAVKTAALGYYTALRDLYTYDRRQLPLHAAAANPDEAKAMDATDELYQTYKDKQAVFNEVYKKEDALSRALRQFDIANGL